MTTLQAISQLAGQIEHVYESVADFEVSHLETELVINDDWYSLNIYYRDSGEGEIRDLRYSYWKKYLHDWRKIHGMSLNFQLIESMLKTLLKEHYSEKLVAYKEEHAADLAEIEAGYYEDMYYDQRMCLALGK